MPTMRMGYPDNLHASRINHLTGTAYPAAPASLFLALYSRLPLSDGSGANEATGTRPALALSASPLTDPNNGKQYKTNTSSITVTLINASPSWLTGFGVFDAATSGNLYYVYRLPSPFQVAALSTITIPASSLRVYSEAPD